MTKRTRREQRGFTLVEVLVAFAILAVSLGFLMHVIANVLSRTAEADLRSGAVQIGQSLLDRVGVDLALTDGTSDGESSNRYHWRLKIEPYGDADDRLNWPVVAHQVTVTVSWGDNGDLSLSTLKLGPKDLSP